MPEPFIAEIRIVSFGFAPRGWALCDGTVLPIAQHTALFAVLGTTYGGDGRTTFGLPDLRGRVAVHAGSGIDRGGAGGEETHVMTDAEMPGHMHTVRGDSQDASTRQVSGNVWAAQTAASYTTNSPDVTMHPSAIAEAGGGKAHENRQPYVVLNFIIALEGVFPSGQ